MKKLWIKRGIKIFIFCLVLCLLYGMVNSFFGWWAYEKWKYRVASDSIEESKKWGVFLRELHYKVFTKDKSFNKKLAFYIERGFRFGKFSSEDTRPVELSEKKPYQVGYSVLNNDYIGEYHDIVPNESKGVLPMDFWMNKPSISDTLIFGLYKKTRVINNIPMDDSIGYVKVWNW